MGNNVLAQVPNLRDVVDGLGHLLAPAGRITIEVPHVLRLLEGNQFDTIYHEHFSYFTLASARGVFADAGLALVDVQELPSHGGSLRLHFGHAPEQPTPDAAQRIRSVAQAEATARLTSVDTYQAFNERIVQTKYEVLDVLTRVRRAGHRVVGYGAPGKANTFLNYCGIRNDLVEFLVDRNPYKHGRFTPGTHIPILPPEHLTQVRPEIVWILPWNLRREIGDQLAGIAAWAGRLLVAIPRVEVFDPGTES